MKTKEEYASMDVKELLKNGHLKDAILATITQLEIEDRKNHAKRKNTICIPPHAIDIIPEILDEINSYGK